MPPGLKGKAEGTVSGPERENHVGKPLRGFVGSTAWPEWTSSCSHPLCATKQDRWEQWLNSNRNRNACLSVCTSPQCRSRARPSTWSGLDPLSWYLCTPLSVSAKVTSGHWPFVLVKKKKIQWRLLKLVALILFRTISLSIGLNTMGFYNGGKRRGMDKWECIAKEAGSGGGKLLKENTKGKGNSGYTDPTRFFTEDRPRWSDIPWGWWMINDHVLRVIRYQGDGFLVKLTWQGSC